MITRKNKLLLHQGKSSWETIIMILLKQYFSTPQVRISPTELSQSNRIILEITDINEVGEEVTRLVQEQEKDVALLDYEDDKENVQNYGNIRKSDDKENEVE